MYSWCYAVCSFVKGDTDDQRSVPRSPTSPTHLSRVWREREAKNKNILQLTCERGGENAGGTAQHNWPLSSPPGKNRNMDRYGSSINPPSMFRPFEVDPKCAHMRKLGSKFSGGLYDP